MKKVSIIIISVLVTVIIFAGVFFVVLYKEQERRQAKRESEQDAFLARLEETELARKEYFESVKLQKESFRAQMEESQRQYEKL